MIDNTGLNMMMSAIRRLIPEHVWTLVEGNIMGMGKTVAEIQATQKRIEEKQDQILRLLSPTDLPSRHPRDDLNPRLLNGDAHGTGS